MVLLSQLIRTAAITGRADRVNATWFAGRQGGRWVEQTVREAMPGAAPGSPAETLRKLSELHERGVITDAELEKLRARLRV
jgi:Short C-terminal domain